MIRGFLEAVESSGVIGWAFDDADPAVSLTVRVLLGSRVLGSAEPNMLRPDLPQWRDGRLGFAFAFEAPLSEAQLTAITAEAARPEIGQWHILPRFASAAHTGPATVASPMNETAGAGLAVTEFWSDDPARAHIGAEDSIPIFITGSNRSGTSALFGALVQATRYRGFYEGHVLDVAIRVMTAVDAHLDKKRKLLPAAAVNGFHLGAYPHPRVRGGVRQFLRVLAAGHTTPFWVDKTPSREMILSVPIIAQTWPNACFIFMKRRGLENVMSRLRKFPETDFKDHCQEWALIMSDWRRARTLIPERFVELEQRNLLDDPMGAAHRVGSLVNLDELEIDALGGALRKLRIEVTDPAAQVVGDISATGWTPEMIGTFRAICGPEMEAYGYTWDARYCV